MNATRKYLAFFVAATVVLIGIFTLWYLNDGDSQLIVRQFKEKMNATGDFQVQLRLYTELLTKVGATKAQDALASVIPPTTRSHAISHEAGYYLYETKGLEGIGECKNYFNGGCVHGLLERYIADHGISDLTDIIKVCLNARTLHEARECPHGAGHGFLLIAGYANLPQAVRQCESSFKGDALATSDCFDGVFMENNFGPFNAPPSDRWYKPDDPQYPCDDSRISADKAAHDSCWFMQSQATLGKIMYPRFDGDVSKVATYCAAISSRDDQTMCYLGLSRQIQSRAGKNPLEIESQCALLGADRKEQCMADAAESAYSFGDENSGIALCLATSHLKEYCFVRLFDRVVTTSYSTLTDQRAACTRMPTDRVEGCQVYVSAHASSTMP